MDGQSATATSGRRVLTIPNVISIIRLTEMSHAFSSMTDELLAFDSLLFLPSAFLCYLAMRDERMTERLEHLADLLFPGGMVFMVACTFLFVYALDHG